MKKYNLKLSWVINLLIFSFLVSACVKQNLDNYDADAINELSIDSSSLPPQTVYNLNDTLKLQAKVNQSHNDGNLSYKWSYYLNTSTSNVKVLTVVSETSSLVLPLNMVGGTYAVLLEVTDNNTGVKAYATKNISLKKITAEGWILLTWKNNKANISIVSSSNEVYKDFLPESPNYPITEKPEWLKVYNDNANTDSKVQNVVLKTASSQLYFMDYNTFHVQNTAREAFVADPGVNLVNFDVISPYLERYLFDENGLIYQVGRGTDSASNNFPAGYSSPLGGDYKAAPMLIPTESITPISMVFHDVKGQRLLYQTSTSTTLRTFQATPDGSPFDLHHFSDNILFADIGNSPLTYVVGRNASGEINVYSMGFGSDVLDTYPARAKNKLDIPTTASVKLFAVPGALPMIYYILDNAIYLYKIPEKTTTKLYTFPSEETVVDFRMFRSYLVNNYQNANIDKQLIVATNKGDEGVFYTFALANTGDLSTGNYQNRIGGFDPIISISYKELRN